MHTFPASRGAAECWSESTSTEVDPAQGTVKKSAYQQMQAESGDGCGVLRLAGRSIATPFTGATAGALVIGELLRLCHGGARMEFTSLHLARPDKGTVIAGAPWPVINPGLLVPDASG
jgi:hypothetical protein